MKLIAPSIIQLSVFYLAYFDACDAIPTASGGSLLLSNTHPLERAAHRKRQISLDTVLRSRYNQAAVAQHNINLTELLILNDRQHLVVRDLLASEDDDNILHYRSDSDNQSVILAKRGTSVHDKRNDFKSAIRNDWENVKALPGKMEQRIDEDYKEKGYGSWVINRATGAYFWEYVPTLTAVGMHIAFNSTRVAPKLLEPMFKLMTDLTGKQYERTDQPYVLDHITSFISEYGINTSELAQQNLTAYPTFNSFFARKLIPGARPIDGANDSDVITSPADSRCVVFQSVQEAEEIWIKGKKFSVPALLGVNPSEATTMYGAQPDIAVFRLAPQDYHRFHSPMNAILGPRTTLGKTYYTVNPIAIKEDLDVFVGNRRVVQTLENREKNINVAFVAVGALLVGSMQWSQPVNSTIDKGDDLGWFQFGGSTVILVAPEGTVSWDEDLVKNSRNATEMLVRMGSQVGRFVV
ncbi:hypothetical protein FRB93_003887 [Tulasnella sp. JGI-2019a]|nr:hypothetical protein FRB93_003887 [Tulasnella sp. JGI-2019a]